MKIMVIAPHPDDEVIGAGGTLSRHTRLGDEVHVCVVTKAYAPDWAEATIKARRQEVLAVAEILGIKKIHFLDLPTVKLDTVPQKELNDLISNCIDNVKPQIVYTPHGGDLNKDHRLVFESTMVATRPIPGCPVKKVLCYELLSSTEWGNTLNYGTFTPNFYVDIADTLDTKLKAMAAYKTELKEPPHPRSLKAISILASLRGLNVGIAAAEAFRLIRETWI